MTIDHTLPDQSNSYWDESIFFNHYPKTEQDEQTDIVIVGAGLKLK